MEIESGETADRPCSCCGGTTRTVWGYVYCDGDARAVYYVSWTIEHPDQGLSLAISIGRWGDSVTSAQRETVAMEGRFLESGPGFMVVDAESSAWGNEEFLGAKLSRSDALSSPVSKEAFSIVDRLIQDDVRIKEFITKYHHDAT